MTKKETPLVERLTESLALTKEVPEKPLSIGHKSEKPAAFECTKCHRSFRDGYNLRQHLGRKRPCSLIVEAQKALPHQCRFCGRGFSRLDTAKRHQKISCPILKDGGMEVLYEHVLKQSQMREQHLQTRISELETRLSGQNINVLLDQRVFNTLVINMFGKENKTHISADKVREILNSAVALSARGSAVKAVCDAALLIYSDPEHPENITCYIPNKRDGTALVHGEKGWEIKPVPLVLPPIAKNSVDLLFDKQPFDEGAKAYANLLSQIRNIEQEVGSPGSELKAVLVRNKSLLLDLMGELPKPSSKTREET